MTTDELIDLVDGHDAVVSTCWRSEKNSHLTNPNLYGRAVLAFLVNQQGLICILRRAARLDYLPNHWAVVGGGVQSGETYDVALAREVAEEVNIDISHCAVTPLGIINPSDFTSNYFKAVYEIRVATHEIAFNPNDWSEFSWVDPQEISRLINNNNDLFAPDLLYMLERFYLKPHAKTNSMVETKHV